MAKFEGTIIEYFAKILLLLFNHRNGAACEYRQRYGSILSFLFP